MLHDMFEQSGVYSETCTDMGGLTEKLRDNRYDLLTTDLKMPDISGYEVLELLRSSDIGNSRTIPVLAITASGSITEKRTETGRVFRCSVQTVLHRRAADSGGTVHRREPGTTHRPDTAVRLWKQTAQAGMPDKGNGEGNGRHQGSH